MGDNPDQRRLQALLRFATEAGSHGSDSAPTASAGDRAWLNEALRDYAAKEFDPVRYIKLQLSIIHRYLNPIEMKDERVEIDQAYEALEGISDNCDQVDLAKDLHKVGGFDVMIQCMKHKDSGICWRACDVVATAAQNHEYCQDALIEMKVLPIVLHLVDSTSADSKVREKAFYALSCMVRGNENALKHLNDNDGFSTLIRAMQSDSPKLKMKSVFFVKSLCEGDAKYASILHERGIEQQIVGMLQNHDLVDSPESLNVIENLLGCLYTLVSSNVESKKESRDPSFGLLQLLQDLKEKFSSKEEYQECARFCELLSNTCFQVEDDADDR